MKVAYLVNRYPQLSHSFIRREIEALEHQGIEIERITIRPSGSQIHPADAEEAKRTWVLLRSGWLYILSSFVLASLKQPVAFATAAWLAIKLGLRNSTKLLQHIAYFLEACVLRRKLAELGCQHLHAHFGTNPATVALLTRRLGGPAYSFTVHGPEEFDHPYELGLPEKIAGAAFVVAISSFGRSQLYRWTQFFDWHKVQIVRCGVSDSFMKGEPTSVPASPRFVCVGRLCEQKGQHLLLQAIHELARAQVRCELVLVGDGPMQGELESAIEQLGIGDRVQLAGPLGEEDVRRQILQARAMVLPSFAEGLPVVLMEALALFRPVVSTYVAGIPELVVPGTCGWLVPAGSVEALARAFRECLEAGVEQLSEMGKNGYELVRSRHSSATEAGKLRELFKTAIGAESGVSLRSSAHSPTMASQATQVSHSQVQ